MERHAHDDTTEARVDEADGDARSPFYVRALRLTAVRPGRLLCFFFFEGAIALAVILSLAERISWWSVLALPAAVAAMVKLNDMVAGGLARRTGRSVITSPFARRRRTTGPAVGVVAVEAPDPVVDLVPEREPAFARPEPVFARPVDEIDELAAVALPEGRLRFGETAPALAASTTAVRVAGGGPSANGTGAPRAAVDFEPDVPLSPVPAADTWQAAATVPRFPEPVDTWNADEPADRWRSDETAGRRHADERADRWRSDEPPDREHADEPPNRWRVDEPADRGQTDEPTDRWHADRPADRWRVEEPPATRHADESADRWRPDGTADVWPSGETPRPWRSEEPADGSPPPVEVPNRRRRAQEPADAWRADDPADRWRDEEPAEPWRPVGGADRWRSPEMPRSWRSTEPGGSSDDDEVQLAEPRREPPLVPRYVVDQLREQAGRLASGLPRHAPPPDDQR